MIGRTVGRFRITAKLGEGGMGSVWKAEDSLLGRSIALKFLPEALANQTEPRRRFLREAQAASALDHPGIATVHDAGEADGLVYIAMQLVDGETVSDVVARGPLPVAEAIRIAAAAAEALAHAHTRGVLHRDISARNIMMRRDGRVVVVDFGLALPEGQSRLTQSATAMGTVAYMAPEVALGKRADRRSDIYGLGVVLYEMLTGALPFEAEQPQALLYAAVHASVEAPSIRRGEVPPDLDRIVLKALAKDPGRRYQTAGELADDLSGSARSPGAAPISVSREVTTPVPGSKLPSPRWRRRSTTVLLSVTGFLTLVILGVIVLRTNLAERRGRVEAKVPSVAVLPLHIAGTSSGEIDYYAEGISEALATRLTELTGLNVTPWMTSRRYLDPKESFKEIARELGVDVLVVGTFRGNADSLQATLSLVDGKTGFARWGGEFVQPRKGVFEVQREIALQVATRLRGKLTGEEERHLAEPVSHSAEAYECYLRGSLALQKIDKETYEVARGLLERALELDSTLAMAYVGLGVVHTTQYDAGWVVGSAPLQAAETDFKSALRLEPRLARARRGLIRVHFEREESEDCLKIGKEARILGLNDIENLLVRADAYHFGALYDKAGPLYRRVLDLDPANDAALAFLAINGEMTGRYHEAIEAGRSYLDRFGNDPDVFIAVRFAFACLEDFDGVKSFQAKYGKSPSDGAPAWLLDLDGRHDEARRAYQHYVEASQEQLRRDPSNLSALSDLATEHAHLGDRRAFLEEEARLVKSHPSSAVIRSLGLAHAALGDTTQAIEFLRQSLQMGSRYEITWACPEVVGLKPLLHTAGYRQFVRELERENDRLRALY